MSIISHAGRDEISNRITVIQIHQTLNLLAQAGRVRLDSEEIDALAYALDSIKGVDLV